MNSNSNRSITVNDFVYNYKQLTSDDLKKKMIKSIIKTDYVPILDKKLYLQVMLDNSVVENGGRKYIDMFINKINVTTAILSMYTNFNLSNKKDKDQTFKNYDLLAKNDLLNTIFNEIPESELATILDINDQLLETFYNKNNTVEAFISNLVEKFSVNFGILTNSSLKSLSSLVDDKEKINDLITIVKEIIKK